ncbi:MAG TPA: hypothetical protein VGG20_06860 [Thermoanaerobaculia bacterium]
MKKRPQAPALRIAAPDALAERGAADLQAGRFKDAIEAFRRLVRIEPRPEWQHALAAAYAGRARTLAAKGMVKEAVMVLDNADAADGTVHEPMMRLACLVRLGDPAAAARTCARFLGATDDAAGVTEADRARIADLAAALALAGHPPAAGDTPAKDFAAAQKALAAWLGGAAAGEIDGLLNAIPLRSPFKPLRLILKSLITDDEDPGRRTRLLDMIPPDSAFAALARAARVALSGDPRQVIAGWNDLGKPGRTFVAEVTGRPAASVRILTELGDAERRGPDALLDALMKNADHLPAADLRAACLELLAKVPNRIARFERRFGALDPAERHRILALAARGRDWDEFERHWLDYARLMETAAGPDAALSRSVVYRHLADNAFNVPWLANPRQAEDRIAQWLEKSVEADPEDRDSTLKLIARLRETGRIRERNRWAEQAAGRFPADPLILTEALDAAAERGAYRKAAALAEKLLDVDPINTQARQRLIELGIGHARKKMRDGRPDLAGKALDEAARRERRDAPDGALTLARGLVAVGAGAAEQGWAEVRAGVARLGDGVAGWLRAILEGRAMGFKAKDLQGLRRDLDAVLRSPPDSAAIVAALTVLNRREVRDDRTLVAEGLAMIRRWLDKGRDCAFTSAEFQTVAPLLERLGAFDLLAAYAGSAAAREPDELLYDFYAVFARVRGKVENLGPADMLKLDEIARKAGERKDMKLAAQIANLLDAGMAPLPFDDFDEDFDDPFGGPFGPPGVEDAVIGAAEKAAGRARVLLERHSPDEVVEILLREYADTPLGRNAPDKFALRALFTLMVEMAAEERGGSARSRRRGRGRR